MTVQYSDLNNAPSGGGGGGVYAVPPPVYSHDSGEHKVNELIDNTNVYPVPDGFHSYQIDTSNEHITPLSKPQVGNDVIVRIGNDYGLTKNEIFISLLVIGIVLYLIFR